MQTLPGDFLAEIAREYDLSQEQTEVFIAIFSSKQSQQEIAYAIHISPNALRTRMTGVYQKFSFGGRVPNKSRKLRDFLLTKYQKSQPENITNTSLDETAIDALVTQVREKIRPDIQQRCGTMLVLDMTQPIGLGEIYTNVNILEKITARSRKGLAEFREAFNWDAEEFERFGLGGVAEERVPGLEAVKKHSKLMVWGKPGAGKTTFLKYLAMQSISGIFQGQLIPIFITLKNFAETTHKPDLFTYIQHYLNNLHVTVAQFKNLLKYGKVLILLDGLDEVNEEDSRRVIQQIQTFADQSHKNHFAITCRIAAKEYTFQGFTEVEVADFDDEQIRSFANKWFRKDENKAERFLPKLQENKPIQELATNPLLLTLLCLVFDEVGNFSSNRGELYEEGIDVLLKKWDAKHNIERDQVYKKLSLKRKENLLSNIAFHTFSKKDYFFKQRTVEQYISDYISNLPDAKTDPEALLVDSYKVLKSIEAQHGLLVERAKKIYSFSHLTFQEYFTARKIVDSRGIEPMQNLASHITEKRWREVFLLVAGIMEDASDLLVLMKQSVDNLVAGDAKIQKLLCWLREKSNLVEIENKSSAIRAFYLPQSLNLDPSLSLFQTLSLSITLDLYLSLDLHLYLCLSRSLAPSPFFSFSFFRSLDLEPELEEALQNLYNQLPNLLREKRFPSSLREELLWLEVYGKTWAGKLRSVMIKYRNIGHDWQFSEEQKKLLKQYYNANKFLIKYLNSDCYVSRGVRRAIEDTLLLPIADIHQSPLGN